MIVREHVDTKCTGKLVLVANIFYAEEEWRVFICNKCGNEYKIKGCPLFMERSDIA